MHLFSYILPKQVSKNLKQKERCLKAILEFAFSKHGAKTTLNFYVQLIV